MFIKKGMMILLIGAIFISFNLINAEESSTNANIKINPLYKLNVNIFILNNFIQNGDNLSVQVILYKSDLTTFSSEIPVDLNYEIRKGRRLIDSGFIKTVDIINFENEIVEISVDSDYQWGHRLKIIATNPQSISDSALDWFYILNWFNPPFF